MDMVNKDFKVRDVLVKGGTYTGTRANMDRDKVLNWIADKVRVGMVFTIRKTPGKYDTGESVGNFQLAGYYHHTFKITRLLDNYADCVYLTDPFMGDHRGFTYAELYELCHTGLARVINSSREMEAV
jgi:hypothetical protein